MTSRTVLALILAALLAVPVFAVPEAAGTLVLVSGELVGRTTHLEEPGDLLTVTLTVATTCGTTAPAPPCQKIRVECGPESVSACSAPEIGSAVRVVARLRNAEDGAPVLVFVRAK